MWFSASQPTHLAFYSTSSYNNNQGRSRSNVNFSSAGRGFQAQQRGSKADGGAPESQQTQRRTLPPGLRRMIPEERELYRNEICQVCNKQGHIAKICWWVISAADQSAKLPQALAALTLDNTITDTDWTADSAATDHMAANQGSKDREGNFGGPKEG
ncbi:uncharacterized protein LOC119370254 [Jatropha curcas]|uniref:uncharacterized protein LOC119370254 n=1 Tax=Jatropha curcas TaxID=180498 RepID=UPI001894053B|nr:uncharacterized protein LOC119370254 [Jatropha curcas]